ncbi:MAG: hypothetical protein AB1635_19020 [Acidobacteriota bacterium]
MDLSQLVVDLMASIIAGAAGGLAVKAGFDAMSRGWLSVQASWFGPCVLVWSDLPANDESRLAARLRTKLGNVELVQLRSAAEFRRHPLNRRCVKCVILIVTDVTKIADDEHTRRDLESRLVAYVNNGGGLIGLHDAVYRRIGLDQLRQQFGCESTTYSPYSEPILYVRTRHAGRCPPFGQMTETFSLDDGELLKTSWVSDAVTIYETPDGTPLVVCRDLDSGRLVWLHSANRGENGVASSIRNPDRQLIELLKASIDWAGGERR